MLRPRENDFCDDLWSQGLLSPVQLFLELPCSLSDLGLKLLLAGWVEIREGALSKFSLVGVNLDLVQERRVIGALLLERR